MFDNLKAFIRQGRHAADSKKANRSEAKTDEMDLGRNLDTTEASISCENVDGDSSEPFGSFDQAYKVTSLEKEQTKPSNHHKLESPDNHERDLKLRYEAAHQIVEEENLMKKQVVEYENLTSYKILDRMGDGAFSVVYRAIHITSGKEVAIKILRKFQMDDVQRQSVLKEVTIMRQLNHPNIVRFIEFIDSSSYYYIVQELVKGGEIFSAIVDYTYFSEDLARHVISQVAEAVKYLHEEVGIVHRDIKPENLLFFPIDVIPSPNPSSKLRRSDDPETKKDEGEFIPGVGAGGVGVVKLADFGLSKQVWEHNTKTPCGTVGYTAPEIIRDERYSKKVDIWAIGCVLYTLLCGFPPFYDERIETLTKKVAHGEFTFLSPWWDEISDGARYCVSRLLTVNPHHRYTIDELLNDPWMKKVTNPVKKNDLPRMATHESIKHPLMQFGKPSKNDLYSPAIVAFRDAFDISTAINRMEEESALASTENNHRHIEDLLEEEEEETEELVDQAGRVLSSGNTSQPLNIRQKKLSTEVQSFDLRMNASSLLERRRNRAALSVKT